MKLSDYKDKITWSMADKGLFAGFAVISLMQANHTSPEIWGLFAVILNLNNAILVISDAVALVNIIQFGINEENAPKVNLFALLIHIGIVLLLPFLLYIFKDHIANTFKNPEDIILVLTYLPLYNIASLLRMYCLKFVYKYSEMNKLFVINLMYFLPITLITLYFIFNLKVDMDFLDFAFMYMCGNIVSSIVALILVHKKIKIGLKGDITIKQMMNFSIPLLFTQFLNAIPKYLDSIIILYFFDKRINGIYNTAKTFFRVFDETLFAVQGLLYPAIIRRINKLDIKGVRELLIKSVSFLLVGFIFGIIAVQFGVIDWVYERFIDSAYIDGSLVFKILSFAALFLPFFLFNTLINAEGNSKLLLKYVIYAVTGYLLSMYLIGLHGNALLVPIGFIIYVIILGSCGIFHFKNNYSYNFSDLFQCFTDANNFLKNKKVHH